MDNGPNITDEVTVLGTLGVTAPVNGHVVVTGAFSAFFKVGVAFRCDIATTAAVNGASGFVQQVLAGDSFQSVTLTEGFQVAAGTTTFFLACQRTNSGQNASTVTDINLTAVYSPNRL